MTALRTTGPGTPPRRTWTRCALLLLPLALSGCGGTVAPGPERSPHAVGQNDPAWTPGRVALPPPDLDRINYDERTRTVTLYELSGNDRWLVKFAGEVEGRITGPRVRMPEVDPTDVFVYYARPGARPSVPVTLKQIQESGGAHVSFAGPR